MRFVPLISYPDIRRVQCVDQRVKDCITSSWMTRTDREKHTHVETWTEHPRRDKTSSHQSQLKRKSPFSVVTIRKTHLLLALYLFCVLYCGLITEMYHTSLIWFIDCSEDDDKCFYSFAYMFDQSILIRPDVMVLLTEVKMYIRDSLFEFSLCLASVFPMPVIWSSFPWLIIMFTCSLHYLITSWYLRPEFV